MPNPVFIRPETLFRVVLLASFGQPAVVAFSLANFFANAGIGQRTVINCVFQYGAYIGCSLISTSSVGPTLFPVVANSELIQKYVTCPHSIYSQPEKALTVGLLFASAGILTRSGTPKINLGMASILAAYSQYMSDIVASSSGSGGTPFLFMKPRRSNLSLKQEVYFNDIFDQINKFYID